jgi:hypothetical protein
LGTAFDAGFLTVSMTKMVVAVGAVVMWSTR